MQIHTYSRNYRIGEPGKMRLHRLQNVDEVATEGASGIGVHVCGKAACLHSE